MMLVLVGNDKGDLGFGGLRTPVVTPDGDEPAVVLGHQGETILVVHPRNRSTSFDERCGWSEKNLR